MTTDTDTATTTSNYHQNLAATKEKSTLIVFLLWLFPMFIGCFGFHRFYAAGLTGSIGINIFNILYFFTFGFFFIMWLADIFLLWGLAGRANDEAMVRAKHLDDIGAPADSSSIFNRPAPAAAPIIVNVVNNSPDASVTPEDETKQVN